MALRRISLALGVVLFVAGAAILGIGLFSYFGQGDAAPEVVAPILDEVDTAGEIYDWHEPDTSTIVVIEAPPPSPTPPPPPPVTRDVPYRMVIESIGVDAPVVTYGLDADGVPQVPLNGGDVAWYDFSAIPGVGSNAVFAGHVNWARAPAVFAQLDKLQVGDTVRLVAEDGEELVYSVSDNFLVDPADPASLQVMEATPTDTITLITCGGTWIPDPSERFGGDYTNRVIVRATLVSINAAGVPQTAVEG